MPLALERNRIGIVGPDEVSIFIELCTSQCLNMIDLIFQRAWKLPDRLQMRKACSHLLGHIVPLALLASLRATVFFSEGSKKI